MSISRKYKRQRAYFVLERGVSDFINGRLLSWSEYFIFLPAIIHVSHLDDTKFIFCTYVESSVLWLQVTMNTCKLLRMLRLYASIFILRLTRSCSRFTLLGYILFVTDRKTLIPFDRRLIEEEERCAAHATLQFPSCAAPYLHEIQ
jgi:hypothetical protein